MHGVSTPGTKNRASHQFLGVELFSSPLKSLIFSLRLSGAFSLSLLILLSFLKRVAEREVEIERSRVFIGFSKPSRNTEIKMAFVRVSFGVLAIIALIFSIVMPAVQAEMAPAPAPTSDGTSIDQGIAYLLMVVALVLTYLIHPLDATSYNLF